MMARERRLRDRVCDDVVGELRQRDGGDTDRHPGYGLYLYPENQRLRRLRRCWGWLTAGGPVGRRRNRVHRSGTPTLDSFARAWAIPARARRTSGPPSGHERALKVWLTSGHRTTRVLPIFTEHVDSLEAAAVRDSAEPASRAQNAAPRCWSRRTASAGSASSSSASLRWSRSSSD